MGIFEKAIIENDEILNYIPQRDPIVMVDRFYGIVENSSYSSLDILATNIFCENGIFNESGIIEHIAQSAALRIGYICKNRGEDIPIGFIGSVNGLEIFEFPKEGAQIQTTITIEQEFMNLTVIKGITQCGNNIIAQCKMKIFLQEENNG